MGVRHITLYELTPRRIILRLFRRINYLLLLENNIYFLWPERPRKTFLQILKTNIFFPKKNFFTLMIIIKINKKLLSPNKHYKIKAKDFLKLRIFTENYNPNLAMDAKMVIIF